MKRSKQRQIVEKLPEQAAPVLCTILIGGGAWTFRLVDGVKYFEGEQENEVVESRWWVDFDARELGATGDGGHPYMDIGQAFEVLVEHLAKGRTDGMVFNVYNRSTRARPAA